MAGAGVRRALSGGRLAELFGIRYPIVQGPFGGGLSSVPLAAAVSAAGGLGSYGAHVLTPDQITALVADLRAATDRPFAVNLWIPQPGEHEATLSRDEYERHVARLRPYLTQVGIAAPPYGAAPAPDYDDQIGALLAAAPPVISFVMGVPSPDVLAEAARKGIRTIGTATTVDEALTLQQAGIDAVVASGSDAGGHRGAFLRPVAESLIGTFALIPQVADAVSVPVIAAGGIADARGVVAALTLGADGVQIGTGFLKTDESGASPAHRRALGSTQARVTVLTRLFTGRLARGIPNRFIRELAAAEADVPPYPLQSHLTAGLRAAAHRNGDPDLAHLWAGQAALLSQPGAASTYLKTLVADATALIGD